MYRWIFLFLPGIWCTGCSDTKPGTPPPGDAAALPASSRPGTSAHIFSDTLQFVEFDENGDYAFALFVDRNGDPVTRYYDGGIDPALGGKLFSVRWQTDTFYAAGDGDTPYRAEKMLDYSVLDRPAFMPYKTRDEILIDVGRLPMVRALPEKDIYIEQWPDAGNNHYTVVVNTPQAEPGSYVAYSIERYRFRVYQVPVYAIHRYDPERKRYVPVSVE